MKRFFHNLIATAALAVAIVPAQAKDGGVIGTSNLKMGRVSGQFHMSADLVLDSLSMSRNRQLYVTPVVENGDRHVTLPTVLINGRSMHYSYERGIVKASANYPSLYTEVQRHNGTAQSIAYQATVPLEGWMLDPAARLYFAYDTCGCGTPIGRGEGPGEPLNLNPALNMRLVQITPPVTELPVTVHEGRARVQFEVDRTVLHDTPYVCRNGQKIDNREQLAMIDDSVKYALSDPNVEIASISITGYASPESPYLHNDELATTRSRALAEYLANRYNLPADRSHYSAVPENWTEFRQIVETAPDITEQQRKDLLELIDAPAYGPSDYDAKERTLKTDPRFAALYKSKILPVWFPQLRCTQFAISTRLKPMSDQKLAEIIETTPQLMSPNQMFRVARLYPEGSPEFNRVIAIALKHYPKDPIANLNAAVAALQQGDYDVARKLLEAAGDSPEAMNARGVLATHDGDLDSARSFFDKAGNLPEAVKNKALLGE